MKKAGLITLLPKKLIGECGFGKTPNLDWHDFLNSMKLKGLAGSMVSSRHPTGKMSLHRCPKYFKKYVHLRIISILWKT